MDWPAVFGTIPQWIMAGGMSTLLVAWWRYKLGTGKLAIEARAVEITAESGVRDHLLSEIQALRQELRVCEQECAERLDIAEARIKKLDEELWGEKRQRVQEQISLVNTIVQSVDAPELKALLTSLESVQRHVNHKE